MLSQGKMVYMKEKVSKIKKKGNIKKGKSKG